MYRTKLEFKILLPLLLLVFSCKIQDKFIRSQDLTKSVLLGECYNSLFFLNEYQDGDLSDDNDFLIEIVPPKLEFYFDTLTKEAIEDSSFLKISPSYLTYKINSDLEYLEYSTNYKLKSGFLICASENVPKFEEINFKEEPFVIKRQRLISDAKIIKKVYRKTPKKIAPNQFKFEKGNWITVNNFHHLKRGLNLKISDLEKALLEKGYDIKVDNVFSEEDRKMFMEFQKKHNLEVGNLDFYTLKLLGLEKK